MLLALLVVAAVAAGIRWLRANLVAVTVTGRSMEPTLSHGDRVLVRRAPLGSVLRGQLVVLRLPDATDPTLAVKRAVALPGDPMPDPLARAGPVPAGHLVVLGDNRAVSQDSRAFGPVPAHLLLGVVRGRVGRRARQLGHRPDIRPDRATTPVVTPARPDHGPDRTERNAG